MLKKIIETIRIERLRQKMTLKELSEVSTVSVKQICEIENEKVTPSLKTLEKLAQPLGLEIKVYIITSDNKLAKAAGE
ncbi:MAG TPA: XRE family transcriptional regulator [Pelotomaculum sp.]|nr:XRE family transcriptional regulator [Pelotomaculum sp.]